MIGNDPGSDDSMKTVGLLAEDDDCTANRTTYFFNCEDGIWVRSGCFFGTLSEFRDKVRADDRLHATAPSIKTLQYLGFANIAAVTFDQTQLET